MKKLKLAYDLSYPALVFDPDYLPWPRNVWFMDKNGDGGEKRYLFCVPMGDWHVVRAGDVLYFDDMGNPKGMIRREDLARGTNGFATFTWIDDPPRKSCSNCGHVWGAYEDTCHCNGGVCHNPGVCFAV
jgi:hypothetical protein